MTLKTLFMHRSVTLRIGKKTYVNKGFVKFKTTLCCDFLCSHKINFVLLCHYREDHLRKPKV